VLWLALAHSGLVLPYDYLLAVDTEADLPLGDPQDVVARDFGDLATAEETLEPRAGSHKDAQDFARLLVEADLVNCADDVSVTVFPCRPS